MTSKTQRLPKGGKGKNAPSPSRKSLPLRLAAPIVAGGALILIIIGIAVLWRSGSQPDVTGSPAQVSGQPRLAVDREKIDFGKVPLDKLISATFTLSNVGNQPLALQSQPVVEAVKGC